MTSPKLDLERIRGLALKATPGPWQRSGVRQNISENCIVVGPDSFSIIALPVGKNPKEHAGAFCDAGFVAACDPQTILRMYDRIRALETALKLCADDLASEVDYRYPSSTRARYPHEQGRYERDMSSVVEARALLADGEG